MSFSFLFLPQKVPLDYFKFAVECKWSRKISQVRTPKNSWFSFKSVKIANLMSECFYFFYNSLKVLQLYRRLSNFEKFKLWWKFCSKNYVFLLLKAISNKMGGRKIYRWYPVSYAIIYRLKTWWNKKTIKNGEWNFLHMDMIQHWWRFWHFSSVTILIQRTKAVCFQSKTSVKEEKILRLRPRRKNWRSFEKIWVSTSRKVNTDCVFGIPSKWR